MKRAIAVIVAFNAIVLGTPKASADVPAGCVQQFWLYGLRGTTRTICDSPVRPDGSWVRGREFYAPATYIPVSCSWSMYSGYCSGGYWLPVLQIRDFYIVFPETVLNDEPGHIDVGELV